MWNISQSMFCKVESLRDCIPSLCFFWSLWWPWRVLFKLPSLVCSSAFFPAWLGYFVVHLKSKRRRLKRNPTSSSCIISKLTMSISPYSFEQVPQMQWLDPFLCYWGVKNKTKQTNFMKECKLSQKESPWLISPPPANCFEGWFREFFMNFPDTMDGIYIRWRKFFNIRILRVRGQNSLKMVEDDFFNCLWSPINWAVFSKILNQAVLVGDMDWKFLSDLGDCCTAASKQSRNKFYTVVSSWARPVYQSLKNLVCLFFGPGIIFSVKLQRFKGEQGSASLLATNF